MSILCRLFGHKMKSRTQNGLRTSNSYSAVALNVTRTRQECCRWGCDEAGEWEPEVRGSSIQSLTMPSPLMKKLRAGEFVPLD